MRRRTEITVETDRVVLVKRSKRTSVTIWCAACAADSFMFTVDEAAVLIGTTSMNVFRWAEAGRLHWLETTEGKLLICQNSLLRNRRALLAPHHTDDTDAL